MKALLFILLYALPLRAQQVSDTLPGSYQLAVRGMYGFVIAHRPTVRILQEHHVKGFEAELIMPSNGCKDWMQPYLLPSWSLAYQYFDLGNKQMLGSGHALTARMLFPLKDNRKVRKYISAGFGIGYIEKPYDEFENYKNVAIGSHINCVVNFSYRAVFALSRHSYLDAGISFTHFSNGSFRTPNLGINIPALQLGYSNYFGSPMPCKKYTVPHSENKHIDKIVFAAGAKGIVSAHGPLMYGLATAVYTRMYTLSNKSRIGGGIDVMYDRTLPWKYDNLYNEGLEESMALRSGIQAGYELSVGKWLMLIQNGIYIIDQYKEDGLMYTKVGVEYYLTQRLLAAFHLKTHYAKADYFEYGLGYTLNK